MLKLIEAKARLLKKIMEVINQGLTIEDIKILFETKKTLESLKKK